jgi:hypothetical protein
MGSCGLLHRRHRHPNPRHRRDRPMGSYGGDPTGRWSNARSNGILIVFLRILVFTIFVFGRVLLRI